MDVPLLTIYQLLVLILGAVLVSVLLICATLSICWLATRKIRRETAKYAADAEATMQAILAAVRRPS